MKNMNIIKKISQGMYVLTTEGGGCIVDAVSQISGGENPLISVAVMKKNYTNELLHKNNRFAISIIGKEVDPQIIKIFGFNSMRDIDKFEKIDVTRIHELNIINDSLGYMICEIEDCIETPTHNLFIGRLIEADVIAEEKEEMTYAYYQKHKDELLRVITEKGNTAWICTVCGYVFYGEELPEGFKCPICGVDIKYFKKK